MAFSVRPPAPRGLKNFVDVHPSALQLFGCFVVERRLAVGLSQDVLAARIDRTTDWVVAVERGELLPTTVSLLRLDEELAESDDENLPRVLNELNILPWGETAERLRNIYNLPPPPTSDLDEPIGQTAIPLAHEVEFEQRVLTVTPLLVGVAVFGLLAAFGVLREQSPAWDTPNTIRSLGLVAVAISIAGAMSPIASLMWRYLLFPLRLAGNNAGRTYVRKIRAAEEITAPRSLAWVAPAELPFLTPYYRTRARAYAIRTEMAERLSSIALGAAALTGLAWKRASSSDLEAVDPTGWKWLFAASVSVFVLFHVRAFVACGRLASALKLGFGRTRI